MGPDPPRLGHVATRGGGEGALPSCLGGPFGRRLRHTCLVAPASQVEMPAWHQPKLAHWQQECVTRGHGRCW